MNEDSRLLIILIWESGSLDLNILSSFKIHYLYSPRVGTWHSAPQYTILVSERNTPILILSWCWNVTHDAYSILVLERGTRSIFYPGVRTWHPIHILSWYRNVAPDPYSILVSQRDTRSIFYPGTRTWHPIHILSWCRNVTPDPYSILVSERDTRSIFFPGTRTWHPIH